MLKQRIITTLQFFDLQDIPLTLLELHKFLIVDLSALKAHLNEQWELTSSPEANSEEVSIGQVLKCLEAELLGEVENVCGFYALKGRSRIISLRLDNYCYGIKREKLVRRFAGGARFLPFLRGIGLVGSQALGQQKQTSDIDLLILTSSKYLWLTRLLVTAYFQVIGKRRHGKKTANRFCLNHYLVENKEIQTDRNFYTAAEYLKLRPLICEDRFLDFLNTNQNWIKPMFPNTDISHKPFRQEQPNLQKFLEWLLDNRFGSWLDRLSKKFQYKRLDIGEFIAASDEELSFHPNNRKKQLFQKFFAIQENQVVGESALELEITAQ